MITEVAKNAMRFILLVLLQTLIIKNIPLGNYFIPMPYVLFILLLPFETMPLIVLLAAFAMGMAVDLFYDTQGVHATACLVTGFLRVYILRIFAPREGYDPSMKPTVQYMGNTWFFSYGILMILIHHMLFFYLEQFSFHNFFFILMKIVASTIITFGFIYIIQYLFYRKDGILA